MVAAARGVQRQTVVEHSRLAAENSQNVTAKSLDIPGSVPLRKSYIVAATPRCGSTFLCSLLWQTGVLGAPSEYWNCHKSGARKTIGIRMMERLEATSGADYLAKLLACRTSKNGVFGLKAHFFDFQTTLRGFPQVLELLSPVTYICIEREDKLGQAVSLARSLQTGAFTAGRDRQASNVSYDRDLIARCLGSLETQTAGWLRWFESNHIDPYLVTYEKLAANPAGVVSDIVELLGVGNDEPHEVQVRPVQRQSDGINKEWAARFTSEIEAGAERVEAEHAIGANRARSFTRRVQGRRDRQSGLLPEGLHFCDRYSEIKSTEAEEKQGGLGVFAKKRRRDRYQAIIAQNRQALQNARVLDIQCGSGFWSLAALDAGAVHVICLESRQKAIEMAMETFAKYAVKKDSYRFVKARVFAGLSTFAPGAFDVILCQEPTSDLHFFFQQMHRLKPEHVIIDTAITHRKRPVVVFKTTTFKLRQNAPASKAKRRRIASIIGVPNHMVISMLCERFGFRCNFIDWQSLGITKWVGITDYENDRRRTYVLDRIAQRPAGLTPEPSGSAATSERSTD